MNINNFTQDYFNKCVDKILINGGHLKYGKCKCEGREPEGACKKANDKKKKAKK